MVRAGNGTGVVRRQRAREGHALEVPERRRVDHRQVPMDSQAQVKRELPVGGEGRPVQVELQVDVAAAGDEAALEGRAVDQQPDEPRLRMAHVDGSRLLHHGTRLYGYARYVYHQRV